MTNPNHVTPKQVNWFAKVRDGLEKDTGKALEEWIEIARSCPESSHRKRLSWFKDVHGIGINRASTILGAAFETGLGWDNSEALIDRLWKTPESRAIYDAIEACATSLGDDVVVGPRKTFSGFSRKYQFAAARPVRGKVRLGLAVDAAEHNLEQTKSSDSWSERVASVVIISTTGDVNEAVKSLMKSAWETS